MGKAFTATERAAVQEKLRRAGLELFARKGIRGVSIRELVAAAGIAQGGFYTFYHDKADFIADLIKLRVREKLEALRERNGESLADPVAFLSGLIYAEGMHLKENKAFDNMISGTLSLFTQVRSDALLRVNRLYRDYLESLLAYWNANGLEVLADIDGLLNLIRAAGILFSNAALLDEAYFERIFRRFCEAEVAMLVKVASDDAQG